MSRMSEWLKRLRQHTFTIHVWAFALMIFSAALLYRAAQQDSQAGEWALLILFTLANVLVLLVK